MKTIFSHSETVKGNTFIKSILAIDERQDEKQQLETIKKIIDIYLEDV